MDVAAADDIWEWTEALVNTPAVMVGDLNVASRQVMKIVVWDWLVTNVGPRRTIREDGEWTQVNNLDGQQLFRFRDPNKALLFKLTWGSDLTSNTSMLT